MQSKQQVPQTLLEASRYFSDIETCIQFLASCRWPDGVACPTCGGTEVHYLFNQKRWKCKNKHNLRQFSVKVGTIFENSAIGLDKWLAAMWMIAGCKNGISTHDVARYLGITQRSAWFMIRRIRKAVQNGSFQKFAGDIRVDETFLNGRVANQGRKKSQGKLREIGG